MFFPLVTKAENSSGVPTSCLVDRDEYHAEKSPLKTAGPTADLFCVRPEQEDQSHTRILGKEGTNRLIVAIANLGIRSLPQGGLRRRISLDSPEGFLYD